MDTIITRNFLRLLNAGAFNIDVEIEPMSAWKWRRAYQYALVHDVMPLFHDGIKKCEKQFLMQLPDDLKERITDYQKASEKEYNLIISKTAALYPLLSRQQLRPIIIKGVRLSQLYTNPRLRVPHQVEIFFPYQTQGRKADQWAEANGENLKRSDSHTLAYEWQSLKVIHHHHLHTLTNKLLNRPLQNIIETEIREGGVCHTELNGVKVETVPYTLEMLLILLTIANHALTNGLSLKHIIDLGVFLRNVGDKVDFVKLQTWIEKLRLKHMCDLAATLLIQLFHFSNDEIPFMSPQNKLIDISNMTDDMFRINRDIQKDWYFQQGKDIFIHASNTSAMFWQVQHSARYFKYFPSESITSFFTSFAHSLSHIEE